MPRENRVRTFFAVTVSDHCASLYKVTHRRGKVVAVKIGLVGVSDYGIGRELARGKYLAISVGLAFYQPRRPNMAPHDLDDYIVRYNYAHSSSIVALFRKQEPAEACLTQHVALRDLRPCDERWLESTKHVLDGIGDAHPHYRVCTLDYAALIREPEAQSA